MSSATMKPSITSCARRAHEDERKWGAQRECKSTASKGKLEMIDRRMALAAFAAMTLCSASAPAATDWPTRQVTIMVPTGAGGISVLLVWLASLLLAALFGLSFV